MPWCLGALTSLVLISPVVLPVALTEAAWHSLATSPVACGHVRSESSWVGQVYVRRCWFQLLIEMPFEVIRRDVTLEVVCLKNRSEEIFPGSLTQSAPSAPLEAVGTHMLASAT